MVLDKILNVWYQAQALAHPFLDSVFTEKVKKDMKELYTPNSETWVYEENGILIGFIGMMGNEIGGLFVLPNHHSKGVGTQLVHFVAEFNLKNSPMLSIGCCALDIFMKWKTDIFPEVFQCIHRKKSYR